MSTQFALDLRLARRKAGFTQRDAAHLLAARQSAISDLERGRSRPTLVQIVTLSLIYGRSFESFFAEVMQDTRRDLLQRLEDIPEARVFSGTTSREYSLKELHRRLKAEAPDDGGA